MVAIADPKVVAFVRAATECSVYISPTDPGLTAGEILEVGQRAGYQVGELNDALPQATCLRLRNGRFGPSEHTIPMWQIFSFREEPDYRVPGAFDFVFSQFNELIRAQGADRARLERSVLVERAVTSGLNRVDVEAAVTIATLASLLVEKDGLLMRPHGGKYSPLPSEQLQSAHATPMPKPARKLAYPLVKDVIERRTDGRPKSVEPLDAFGEALTALGYKPFRMWWTQMVGELRRSDALSCPATVAVLSAALVEGALAFVVRHARALSIGPMGSTAFGENPRTWKIEELVKSAAQGGADAILTATVKQRADRLIGIRQRIHAGRMLSEFPQGPQDLRPDESRESKETAEIVVRAVLDWLERHPPSSTAS